MKTLVLKPKQALNKAYLKQKPTRLAVDAFKQHLIALLDRVNGSESEEFHKNLLSDFLKDAFYKKNHFINTKGRNDLVIHTGPDAKSPVGVIIEAKKPGNKSEMLAPDKLNVKAFHELLLYYLRERITHRNLEIRHLVATNVHEWYVFDAVVFERIFAQNKALVARFNDFEERRLAETKTDFFYKEIAEPFIAQVQEEIEFTRFDLLDYQEPLRNADPTDDRLLIPLFKLLSPEHLLKLPFANDSNSLDKRFYHELLHLLGLRETAEGGKKVIRRHEPGQRLPGSLLEETIIQLDGLDKIGRLPDPAQYGETHEERIFAVALELCITWINRILFLKLLEGQLIGYHRGKREYSFLDEKKMVEFDDLNALFFQVLAKKPEERLEEVRKLFEKVPHLNSSLFEPTELEQQTIFISNLKDNKQLPLLSNTVLKDNLGKTLKGGMGTLRYLLRFLDAYDFSSEGSGDIQEENKTLISASVLGLIFEKINGYRDGSFFTPGFITMYMCRDAIRRAVVQKFNEAKNWNCTDFEELYDRIEDRREANEIVNSLRVCDPAVGSGHFLVSALNEIVAVKNDLKILCDRSGKRLKEYRVEVVNDELVVTDENGELFDYKPKSPESHRVQEALFHEKQTIIENCLFGVDINPNSVKICRLRLWIELLKNAYYRPGHGTAPPALETLPNIDINIKCGNSLVSRFDLGADLRQALHKSKWTIDSYRNAVRTYRSTHHRDQKREMERLMLEIKQNFSTEIRLNDPLKKRLEKLARELYHRFSGTYLFEPELPYGKDKKDLEKKRLAEKDKLEKEIEEVNAKIEEMKSNSLFDRSFEWRFEFPEVLDDEGDFVGFDAVIGNPPYIRQEEFSSLKPYLKSRYSIFHSTADLLTYFMELGHQLLKPHGIFRFIVSGKFTRAAYGSPLRRFLSSQTEMTHFIDFAGKPVFDEATVDAAIVGFVKKDPNPDAQLTYWEVQKLDDLHRYFSRHVDRHATRFPASVLGEEVWSFDDPKWSGIVRKIQQNGIPLSDWNISINFGIKTGYNEAFVIDSAMKDQLISEDPRSAEVIKPLLRGRDIQKYFTNEAENWLVFIPWHFPLHQENLVGASIEAENLFKTKYKSIFNWLSKHKDGLMARNKTETGIRYEWFALQRFGSNYWPDFERPKLVWKRIGSILRFCYDESGAYCLDSTCMATGEKVKFLTAVLNSKLVSKELFRVSPKTGTGDLIISVQALHPLRVPIPSERQEREMCDLLDRILTAKQSDASADVSEWEAAIDRSVYELYGLTEDEIRLVEADGTSLPDPSV